MYVFSVLVVVSMHLLQNPCELATKHYIVIFECTIDYLFCMHNNKMRFGSCLSATCYRCSNLERVVIHEIIQVLFNKNAKKQLFRFYFECCENKQSIVNI